MLAKPPRAFVPNVSPDLANPVWRLAYGGFDKIVPASTPSSTTAPIESPSASSTDPCVHDSMALPCARGFMCDYLDTGNPDHDDPS